MKNYCPFNIKDLDGALQLAIEKGYVFMTCRQWAERDVNQIYSKVIVLRIDVDEAPNKLPLILNLCYRHLIRGSIFLRMHGPYNPFSFETYRVIKEALSRGFEVGLHSEVVDASEIWEEESEGCLMRDVGILSQMFDRQVIGVASHGGLTGLNNLDFWIERHPSEFGLLYEAYDRGPAFGLFYASRYISDSEWTQWKSYQDGERLIGDTRTFEEHLYEEPSLIYLLIHPETYFEVHPYE